MPRQKGDGRGRLGGRAAGTKNKDKPLKTFLREHSLSYFQPGEDGISQYDLDIAKLDPKDRVDAELKLLNFHTPKMQSTTVDMAVTDEKQTLSQRLSQLAEENE